MHPVENRTTFLDRPACKWYRHNITTAHTETYESFFFKVFACEPEYALKAVEGYAFYP